MIISKVKSRVQKKKKKEQDINVASQGFEVIQDHGQKDVELCPKKEMRITVGLKGNSSTNTGKSESSACRAIEQVSY